MSFESSPSGDQDQNQPPAQVSDAAFFVKVSPTSSDLKGTESNLGISDQNTMWLNSAQIDLTLRANGKADLYYHAYFFEQYLEALAQADDVSKDDFSAQKLPFMKRIRGLSETLGKVIVNIRKEPFTKDTYEKYARTFGLRQTTKKMKLMDNIQRALFVAQLADDTEGLYYIEKLLIQLQGYPEIAVRDQAIVLLNILYDGVDWQISEAFRPVIRSVGQHFIVNVVATKPKDSQVFLCLSAPSPISGNNSHLLTWH
jgi:hypothetical protein